MLQTEQDSLHEICQLLSKATKEGVAKWEPGLVDGIVVARLGNNVFSVNVDEPSAEQNTDGWLITLSVFDTISGETSSAKADGRLPQDRDNVTELVSLWRTIQDRVSEPAETRWKSVISSLRNAIGQQKIGR